MNAPAQAVSVRERPILFSGEMVRALLAGRKTQTRRVMKEPPPPFVQHTPDRHPPKHPAPYFDAYDGGPFWCWWTRDDRQSDGWIRCPYGVPGDRLWVRETWGYWPASLPGERPVLYRAAVDDMEARGERPTDWTSRVGPISEFVRWRPSIHLRRADSRLTLEITDVRVQRLQEISEEDAKAEGVEVRYEEGRKIVWARAVFGELWDSINGKRAPWSDNPWVWAISFKRLP